MAESIRQRMGGSHLGKMTDKELRKLFTTILSDLAAIRTSLAATQADGNNVQVIANNLVSGVGNLQAQVNNLILADANIKNMVNNLVSAVTNIKTNCSNATVNVAAITTNVAAAITNLNAITMANSAPSALNLTA